VIGIDLLGHGDAPKPHEPEAYGDLTTRIVDAIADYPTIDAVGFSLGAITLLQLACRAPDRFSHLIVSGVGANLFRNDSHESIIASVEGRGDPEDITSQLFAQYANQPGNDAKALAAVMRRPRLDPISAERLSTLTFPVLVVLGDRDFAGPADPLMTALPNARLITLKGCDHFATPNDFRFIDATLEFLGASSN
jgi:pimeloyl-ACP methyl ester carboxylesterase